MNYKDFIDSYIANGIAIIPAVAYNKNPSIEWMQYQKTPPTKEQMELWFRDWTPEKSNLAILCGEPSGNLVVLDFDNEEIYNQFFKSEKLKQEAWIIKTPHGHHVYFRTPTPIASKVIKDFVEIKSDKSVVIAPPSLLRDSNKTLEYKIESKIGEIPLVTDLTNAVIKRCKELGANIKNPFDEKNWLHLDFEGYKGDDPPCIEKLIRTKAKLGERDEKALRIAAYYANFKGDVQTAREKINRWYDNVEQSTSNPFSINNALAKISHVRKNKYVFGCNDPFLREYCKPCPLGQKTLIKEILQSPHIIQKIKTLLDGIIAGEDANKLLIFFLLLSGKLKDWRTKQIILLQGEAGGGKTTLANNIAKFFKTKTVGRFSKRALDYSDLKGYEILYLQELGMLDEEEQGVSTLKFLSSDDKGYTVEITVRDPETKSWTTETKTIPPITVITTTTRVDLDPQFTRRAWRINVDESQLQTERVRELKIKNDLEKQYVILGYLKETTEEKSTKLLKQIVESLQPQKILLPYPETIFKILRTENIRVRGDFDKFYYLAYLYAFLKQKQLPMIDDIIFASPSKIVEIFEIAKEPLISMTSGLEKRFRELFEVLEKIKITTKGADIRKHDRENISKILHKSPVTVDKYFRELAKKSTYISKDYIDRKVHYILEEDLTLIKQELGSYLGVFESPSSLALECIKEVKNWIEATRQKFSTDIPSEKLEILRRVDEFVTEEENKLKTENNNAKLGDLESPNQKSPFYRV